MATLITGGTGFIGLAVAEKLTAAGERVILFAATPLPSAIGHGFGGDRTRLIVGDIRSATDVDQALAAEPIDRIVHTAAITPGPERERRNARDIVEVNIGGTVNLVERAAAAGGIRRLVILSSVAVYGFAPPAQSDRYEEDMSCPAPAALYGISKLAAEQAALRLGSVHGLDIRAVRLSAVFGPWEHATGVRDVLSPHRQITQAAIAGRAAVLPRPMPADWIYSRDAASAIAALLTAEALQHGVYNLGGGNVTDLPAWCRLMAVHFPSFSWRLAEAGETASIVHNLPADRAPLAIARMTQDTGFLHRYDLPRAADDYLAWIWTSAGAQLSQ